MKRREFIRNSVASAVIMPYLMNGYTFKALGANSLLHSLMDTEAETDHVLVLIQLSGGNDGVNTVIPLDQYSAYNNARANIAISENKVLRLNGNNATGLNPSMTGMQSLYNEGKMAIVQSVSYPDPSFSHFRATDIWLSAADAAQVVSSGWAGRYLASEFPNYPVGFPNTTMPDPLSIQIGSSTSFGFQGPATNMGMSITDPANFYKLISGQQEPVPNTPAGKELAYIRTIADQTNQYATVIKAASAKVTQQSPNYPATNINKLADQLKIVARLIAGGLKTRIYMVSLGGFDTHSSQTNSTDTTTGVHANLWKNVSDAISVFTDDLKFLGIQKRVMGMTFSEFGRRIKSNASGGTDHGAAAPLFVFGEYTQGGVLGKNPIIPTVAAVGDNVPMLYDFRSVYASLLADWFCVDSNTLNTVLLKNFQPLPLVQSEACGRITSTNPQSIGDSFINNYPNPFSNSTTLAYQTQGGHTMIQVFDTMGRLMATPLDTVLPSGNYKTIFEGEFLPSGVYYARLQNESFSQVRAILKV